MSQRLLGDAKAQARIDELEQAMQAAQNEAATVRRHYLHEKAEREKLENENAAQRTTIEALAGALREMLNQFDNLPHLGPLEGPVTFSRNKARAVLAAVEEK